MKSIGATLCLLIVILSFNAYACVLPLPSSALPVTSERCPSSGDTTSVQLCDAFTTIGPQSAEASSDAMLLEHPLEGAMAARRDHRPGPALDHASPRFASTHCSLDTTVLRI